MKQGMIFALLFTYLIGASGCGVLLYPERQGQKQGRIDVGVAVLDGIGLLFFMIPGLVAFAVDFHQGTIYLPPGGSAAIDPTQLDQAHKIHIDGPVTNEAIEQAILDATGKKVDLNASNVQVFDLNTLNSRDIPTTARSALSGKSSI